MLDMESVLGIGKEPAFDDDADVDISRLAAKDRDAIMARVTPDDSAPPDAFALAQNEIRREVRAFYPRCCDLCTDRVASILKWLPLARCLVLCQMIDRGIQPKGFYNDDAARLQEEFDREHVAEREARIQQRVQLAAKSYLRETVHRRRMERENELREEVEEVAKSPQLEVWLELVKGGSGHGDTVAQLPPRQASLRLSSVGTRALCKSLAFNHLLHALNLSRNALDDMAGKCLASMLRRNTSLRRLELESNNFGPSTAKELADALTMNESLQALNLESNPLTDDEKDFSGIAALSAMLASNKTLKTLNLWRTRLGTEGGKQIALGLEKNATLVCLDIGNNRIATLDGVKIDQRLSKNRVVFEASEQKKIAFRNAQLVAAEKEQERQEQVQKQVEYEHWIEERKLERQEERQRQEQERQRQLKMEEDRLRQLAARKAAEFAARAELEKKKKKKGGKKKK